MLTMAPTSLSCCRSASFAATALFLLVAKADRVQDSEFRVQDSGFMILDSGCRVHGVNKPVFPVRGFLAAAVTMLVRSNSTSLGPQRPRGCSKPSTMSQ